MVSAGRPFGKRFDGGKPAVGRPATTISATRA